MKADFLCVKKLEGRVAVRIAVTHDVFAENGRRFDSEDLVSDYVGTSSCALKHKE